MSQPPALPPQAQMMSMITGYWVTQIVRTVAELKIADHLAQGPLSVERLAELAGTEVDATFRLLRSCASLGLAKGEGERVFGSTPLLGTLAEGVPHSLRDIAIVHGSPGHWGARGVSLCGCQAAAGAVSG